MQDTSEWIDSYAAGPRLLRQAVAETPASGWNLAPVPGRWSIKQVVCHLADAEIAYADRMKRVIAEDCPTFFELDPNVLLPSLHCEARPWEKELTLIESVRIHMLPILRCCTPDDFRRAGVHSTEGSMTLLVLLERITQHIPHHLVFIEEKLRAMGV